MTHATLIVPTRGGAERLPRLFDALAAQTHPEWDAVVVIDGDIDGSQQVVERHAHLPIRAVVLPDGEHHATLDVVEWIAATQDADVRAVPLDALGRIDAEAFAAALPGAALATALSGARTRTLPAVGRSRPSIRPMAVVLPAPLGPSRAVSSPARTSRFRSCRAWTRPNALPTPCS